MFVVNQLTVLLLPHCVRQNVLSAALQKAKKFYCCVIVRDVFCRMLLFIYEDSLKQIVE